jgi:hypothetical protein
MDRRLLQLGFSSVEALDRRILELRRYIAEEAASQLDIALTAFPSERIRTTSLSSLHEAYLQKLLRLRNQLAIERAAYSASKPAIDRAARSNAEPSPWIGALLLVVVAAAVYLFAY